MIEPSARWPDPEHKPPYAGLVTFAGLPWSEDPAELDGIDVAIVGAPFDLLASDRSGTREGPRAIRVGSRWIGPEVSSGVDPDELLGLLDFGDAPVRAFDPDASRAAIEATVGQVIAGGAMPFVLGGDHSITLPSLQACAKEHGALGLVHFDTHTDTAPHVYGHSDNHGTMMRKLVSDGHVDPRRYVQIGLRGGWPGPEEFAWQADAGITHFTAEAVRIDGIDEVVRRAIAMVDRGPAYLSVDIDVLDPAFAGSTGTPEAGGLLPRELLAAVRTLGEALDLRGADVVETAPSGWGTTDVGPLTAAAVVGSTITGVAARRAAES